MRYMGPIQDNTSLQFIVENRNKKCITLDLQEPRGRELLLELVKISDVVACAIITRADTARKLREDPIYIKGFGMSMDAVLPHYRPGFSWISFNALKESSHKAYEMTGIKNPRKEIDVTEVHDCFSITEMLIYEDFGFSPRGRAKINIDNGFFEREGGLPVNVDGGLNCFGHPVGASDIRMTYEVYKQLQYKVDNP